MTDYRYLLDTNVLSRLTASQRASRFVRENCRIPAEVLHEAREFPDSDTLNQIEHPVTVGVLEALVKVMATLPVGDTKLVDLYANQGNADPLLVACAIDLQRDEEQYLNPSTWVVVTNDKALRDKAAEFGLDVLTSAEFLALLGDN